jgi:uncharacterized protein YndB with AHSA1/START domain
MTDLLFERDFDAPAAAVYAGWTESALLRSWWGPSGFTCHRADVDVRVGGTSIVGMRAPPEWGGVELHNSWTYGVAEPGRRLEFVLRFVDASGKVVTPQSLGIPPGVPEQVPHTLTFTELGGGRSRLTVLESGYGSEEAVTTSRRGLEQTLDKLAAVLAR